MVFENPKKTLSFADQKQNDPNEVEKYTDLPNVVICREKLKTLLDNNQEGADFSGRAEKMIYEMLTQRSEFARKLKETGDVSEIMKNFGPQMRWYRDTREAIAKSIDASSEFKWDSNPGWFGINTRPEASKKEGVSIKAYTTIPITEYAFIQHLPDLAKKLRQLALESDDIIRVKIPQSLSAFISHNDSIVVHFKKAENGSKIFEILSAWMKASNVHEAPREMGRTKIAADAEGVSFSELVAKNIANWLKQNAGNYENASLASEAVKHAIKLSQNPPTIQG